MSLTRIVFNPNAFNQDAFSRDVFNEDAFNEDALNQNSFNQDVLTKDTFNQDAFNQDAFNQDVFNQNVFNQNTFNYNVLCILRRKTNAAIAHFTQTFYLHGLHSVLRGVLTYYTSTHELKASTLLSFGLNQTGTYFPWFLNFWNRY